MSWKTGGERELVQREKVLQNTDRHTLRALGAHMHKHMQAHRDMQRLEAAAVVGAGKRSRGREEYSVTGILRGSVVFMPRSLLLIHPLCATLPLSSGRRENERRERGRRATSDERRAEHTAKARDV